MPWRIRRRRAGRTAVLVGALALTTALLVGGEVDDPSVSAATIGSVDCDPAAGGSAPPPARLGSFTGETPRRLIDTRDGDGGVTGAIGAGCVLRIDTVAAGLDQTADAFALSVTAIGDVPGFQQVYPCSTGRLATSNVNNRPGGVPTPNLVVAQPDAAGNVCIFTFVEAHLVVDVSGAWSPDGPSRFRTIDPVRVTDSRVGGIRAPGDLVPREIDLSDHVPPGTTAIVANLTVTRPETVGFLVIHPCDTSPPLASNLNFVAGEDRAVSVVVRIDGDRRVCTASNTSHHVILDLAGFYAPTPQFGPANALRPESGRRLIDSRDGTGGWTTPLADGETRSFDIRSALPDGLQATGVLVNLTVTGHRAGGYASATGCEADTEATSSVNYDAGVDASNLVLVDLGTSPNLCVFSVRGTHVVLDLFGVVRAESDDTLAEFIEIDGHTWPPYRIDATDYATECGATFGLDLDLLPSTSARVNGLLVEPGRIEVAVDGPGDLVRLDLVRGGTLRRHYFRCVPVDFPRAVVTTADDPTPGWYLSTFPSTTGGPGYAVILDEHGAPVWYQATPTPLALFDRSLGGDLLGLPARHFGLSADPDRGAVRTRLDGSLVEEIVTVDAPGIGPGDPIDENPTDHHDIVELPGGGVALVSYPLVEHVDLSGLGAGFGTDETITDNLIQELDADRDLVWQWRASDHFAFEPGVAPTTLVYTHDEVPFPVRWSTTQGHPDVEDVDVFHINSVERIDDGSGDYVVSARHLDAVFRIDRDTGDLAWLLRSDDITAVPKSGGATELDIVGDPLGGPRRMHDARLVGDLLTILDNRFGTGQPTRAVTYRIDQVAGTATFVSAITEPQSRTSIGLGSFRPGPDGGAVITWGSTFQPLFQQFDAEGELTMTVAIPSGGSTYRTIWYPVSSFSTNLLRAASGRTMQIPD